MEEDIKVIARIRPSLQGAEPDTLALQGDDKVQLKHPPESGVSSAPPPRGNCQDKVFLLSKVFNGAATQDDVYEFARPLALSVTRGYNATIFAYGHTGSGKTYTMMGDSRNPGIVSFWLFCIPLPFRVEIKLETGRQEVPKRSPRAFKNDPKFIPNDTRAPLEDQGVLGGTPLDADGAPGLHFHAHLCIYI